MFCKNNVHQISLFDPINQMPKYLQDILKKSWAQTFRDYIFSSINEERFSPIYSSNASRPNSPINVIIGLLIIKEIFQQTDEELIGSLHFDVRYQYALHTTTYEKQPVSINTLTNFRNRVIEYTETTGIDLIQIEVEALAQVIAKHLLIDNKKVRVDSLMVSSSCKKLSRIELVYSVNHRFIKELAEFNKNLIPKECEAYLEEGNKNETIYRTRSANTDSKLDALLKHSKSLFNVGDNSSEYIKTCESFQLLVRMLQDQTNMDENKNLSAKAGAEISSTSLQNPTDPDATFRKKYGNNTGYVANIIETFSEDTSVITGYDLKPNVYSDSKFSDDVINAIASKKNSSDKTKVIVDGAYYEQNKAESAKKLGIELIPSELVGRKPSTDKLSYSKFAVDKSKNIISECPNGIKPLESHNSSKSYTAKFDKETCEKCQYKNKCPFKPQKKYNTISVSEKRYNTELQRAKMSLHEYIALANERAGVEGIPSVLRRRYKIDTMPIRGLLRSKLWVGFKIAAYNFKKLLAQFLSVGTNALTSLFLAINFIFFNKLSFYNLEAELNSAS